MSDRWTKVEPKCHLLAGLVNPGVKRLNVKGSIQETRTLFKNSQLQTNPELVITVNHSIDQSSEHDPRLSTEILDHREALAESFNIPVEQVIVNWELDTSRCC